MTRIFFAVLAAFALLAAVALATPASAAEDTIVDFSPLLEGVVAPVIAAIFGLIGAAAVRLGHKLLAALEKRTGIEFDEKAKARVDDAILWGVDFGKSQALRLAKNNTSIDVRATAVSLAAKYVNKAVPRTLTYFGITPDRLTHMIEARIGVDIDMDGEIGTPLGEGGIVAS